MWSSYLNGDLTRMFEESLITKELHGHFHLTSMSLKVYINKDDYVRCRQNLVSDGTLRIGCLMKIEENGYDVSGEGDELEGEVEKAAAKETLTE